MGQELRTGLGVPVTWMSSHSPHTVGEGRREDRHRWGRTARACPSGLLGIPFYRGENRDSSSGDPSGTPRPFRETRQVADPHGAMSSAVCAELLVAADRLPASVGAPLLCLSQTLKKFEKTYNNAALVAHFLPAHSAFLVTLCHLS